MHYHNAIGSVKRHAVMWKGNYLWWNLLKEIKSKGRKKSENEKRGGEAMGRWKMQLFLLAIREQVNGSEVCSEMISIWKGRERERERSRDTKWHSDGFLTAFFLLGPIFRLVTGHLFIYLPHFLMPQIAAVSLLMVRLHQEQGQPQCKIQWMREASRWCLWKWKYLAHYLCIYFYMWGSMVWHYNKRKPFSYHTILYVNCLLLL